jgi:hypothetical protein
MNREDYIRTREQEKAKELVKMFQREAGQSGGIACAELCVKEILDTFTSSFNPQAKYWNKVLEEIQTY